MNTITNPTEELSQKRKRRGVAAFVGGLVAISAVGAASAAVWSVNEVESEWTLTDCLTKVDGSDGTNFDTAPTDTFYINFDATTTEVDPDTGVAVLQEQLDVRAPAGFRTFSTDTFRLVAASCGYNFTVNLTALDTNTLGEPAVAGNWADKGVKIYVSKSATPGDDFTDVDPVTGWDQTPLTVNSSGTIVNALTGDAVLPDDSELVIGFELVGGSPAGAAGQFRFQVNFTPIPTP